MKPSSKVLAQKARLSKRATNPPITRACVSDGKTERSVSVRKIENGYVVSEYTSGPKGYKSSERFSPTPPKIDIEAPKGKR